MKMFLNDICYILLTCIVLLLINSQNSLIEEMDETAPNLFLRMIKNATEEKTVVNPTTSTSSTPLLIIIEASDISEELQLFLQRMRDNNAAITIYLLLSQLYFSERERLWEYTNSIDAKVIRCSEEVCSNMVYNLVAYETVEYTMLIRWSATMILPPVEKSHVIHDVLRVLKSFNPRETPFSIVTMKSSADISIVGLFTSRSIRTIVSSPCFLTEYANFNTIDVINGFIPRLSILHDDSKEPACSLRGSFYSPSSNIAVVVNVYKRSNLETVLAAICEQSITPQLVLLIQNEMHQSITQKSIPLVCFQRNVQMRHIWVTNWNSYCYLRHYVPIPTIVDNTILVDDDMVLRRDAFAKGIATMRSAKCLTTQKGGLLVGEKRSEWKEITSMSVNTLTRADYAFIPMFMDTEWRKAVFAFRPFSRVYGDILFVSIALFKEKGVYTCVVPQFDFYMQNDNADRLSSSLLHKDLYDVYYSAIARKWKENGYVPVMERSRVL